MVNDDVNYSTAKVNDRVEFIFRFARRMAASDFIFLVFFFLFQNVASWCCGNFNACCTQKGNIADDDLPADGKLRRKL